MIPVRSLLIIEPNDLHFEILSNHLKNSQFKLRRVHDCEKAFQLVKKFRFDLILAECDEAHMDMLPQFKKLAKTPIVILTSKNNEKLAVECMKLGATDYLTKSKEILKKLPDLLLSSIKNHHEKKELVKTNSMTLLSQNIKAISQFINRPIKSGKYDIKKLSTIKKEVSHLKDILKNWIS